ncbi:RadC family protein [Rubripirellula lacrimiformis]|uniref:RadC family protein n=1 Tax=Rubripirellula lacrimiformis TaxID=1930273 RepID=UPI00119DC4A9|nr:DNA repair protein RadC [Rubripirellula lacrimiformis]
MSDERRQRLTAVLNPLVQLDEFSSEQAKQECCESHPGYVTRTLGQLVRDGFLSRVEVDGQFRYRWTAPREAFESVAWIDSQIHGIQVKETPTDERPREKLIRAGAASLSLADLLAILIRVGVVNESALVGGQKVANRFADRLPDLSQCSPLDLKKVSPAVKSDSYCQIMAGIELGRRIATIQAKQDPVVVNITSTREAVEYCEHAFARLAMDGVQEEFHIVSLDTKHKPIQSHRITVGTLDASLVHPREVFRPAIRDAASAVLLVHNHPSGDPTPSREDHQVTDRLTEAGKILGIQVLDHIVVAKQSSVSIREC